jgi:chromosome segregation ATPase
MVCFARTFVRWGLISALALGGATLLIGPERVAGGLAHIRAKAQSVVDQAVDKPTAMRHQLEKLAAEYPKRIGKVRAEVAEVDRQISQFDRDSQVAARVVAMTTNDLDELQSLIAKAEQVEGKPVYVRFQSVRFGLDDAYGEARRINKVKLSYADRVACNEQQLGLLKQQKGRLDEILSKLEDEHSTFETQMWQLDRQIDAIERNGRLIEMTEQLQATLNAYDQWGKLDNLHQLQAKLAELRTIQEAQLADLAKRGVRYDYEQRARDEIDAAPTVEDNPFDDEDDEAGTKASTSPAERSPLAWKSPIIVQ